MFLRTALAACAALALISFDANAAGCTGSSRQRIDCLEKQLDSTAAKLDAAVSRIEALDRRLVAVKDVADKAKATAEDALKKVDAIKPPDLSNVRIQWRVQPGNCAYVEPGTGILRVGRTREDEDKSRLGATCGDDAAQRFDLLK